MVSDLLIQLLISYDSIHTSAWEMVVKRDIIVVKEDQKNSHIYGSFTIVIYHRVSQIIDFNKAIDS